MINNSVLQPFPISEKWSWRFFILVILIIVWLAWPASFYFLNDDHIHIPKAYDGTIGHHNGLRHINDLSLFLDSLLWKENASGYHLTNLLLYVANMVMAIPVLIKLASGLKVAIPKQVFIISSALFGLYAFHSEALFWILCRTASLSMFFNLLSFLCVLKQRQNRLLQSGAFVFFLLGLFTYETLWLYPVWLAIWWWLIPDKKWLVPLQKQSIVGIWILFVIYFPFRLWSTGEALGSYEAAHVQAFHWQILIENSYKLFFRSFLPPTSSDFTFKLASLGIVAILGLVTFLLFKQEKLNRFYLFVALGWLSSYVLFISLGVSVKGFESERYLYYPSLWLCLLTVMVLFHLVRQRSLFLVMLAAVGLYHFLFMYNASSGFKQVSSYSKSSMSTFQSIPHNKRIVVQNLPVYSYGLPLYNYGFKDGIQWLCNGRDSSSVEVLSTRHFEKEKVVINVQKGETADTVIFSGQ